MATKAKKTAKKTAKKEVTINFTNSVEKIKGTARTMNNEVLTTATEVLEDLRNNGEVIREVATERVNAAIATVKNVNVQDGVKFVKETATNINKYGLETAENVLDVAVVTGKEWQGVARKAVNGGLELADKQQEIVFDTLDAVKEQLAESAKRFRGLFSNN